MLHKILIYHLVPKMDDAKVARFYFYGIFVLILLNKQYFCLFYCCFLFILHFFYLKNTFSKPNFIFSKKKEFPLYAGYTFLKKCFLNAKDKKIRKHKTKHGNVFYKYN